MDTQDLDRLDFFTRHFDDLQGLQYWVPLGLITLGGAFYCVDQPRLLLSIILFLGAALLTFCAKRYYRDTFGKVERQPVQPTSVPCSCSIFSPSGPAPRLAGFPLVTPGVQQFLITLALAYALYYIVQLFSPAILIAESQIQWPWVTLDAVFISEPHWQYGKQFHRGALFSQAMYVLYGSFFLSLWLWRGRRRSQRHHLELGALLLGLAAFGSLLGFFVWEDREMAVRIINFFLPAVIQPWVALVLCGSSMLLAGLHDHWQLVRALGRPTPRSASS
jgi:hypothetical protein